MSFIRSTWLASVSSTPLDQWEFMDQDDLVYRTSGRAQSLPINDETVHTIVTSPPYNVAIENYPSGFGDQQAWSLYVINARKAAREMFRVLVPGGRCWLNVQATVPMHPGEKIPGDLRVDLLEIWKHALTDTGFLYRDLVVWVQDSFDGGCSWGSWQSPSAPNLRGQYEVILLVYKPNPEAKDPAGWGRTAPEQFKAYKSGGGGNRKAWQDETKIEVEGELDEDGNPVLKSDWPILASNVWKIPPANGGGLWGTDREVIANNWPAAFPLEVPKRAVRLSTWPGEVVLDPYAGRGTTGWAAGELGRRSVLVDLGYGKLEERVKEG